MDTELIKKLQNIKIFLSDVDGVFTDGKIVIDNNGVESKFFNVKDGHGIKMLINYGFEVGLITGRYSEVVLNRAKELGISILYQKAIKKLPIVENISERYSIPLSQIAYCGDDLIDIPVMKKVGVSFTVNDAVDECKDIADYITKRDGGNGAVREITDLILKANGKWGMVKEKYEIT